MKLEGTEIIKASRERVWEFITDPVQVCQCVPGLESVEVVTPNEKFRVAASVDLGTLKTGVTVDVNYVRLAAPELANFRATAKAADSDARVTSHVSLAETGAQATEMRWGADVIVYGKLAVMGNRLIDSISKQLIGEFFACVRQKLEAAGRAQAEIQEQA